MSAYTTTFNPKTLLGNGDFHDWDYENWSAKADARDAALESFHDDWIRDIAYDYRCKSFAKIDDSMESVLDQIYNDTAKATKFSRLIFALWYAPNNPDKCKELSELLDAEFEKLIVKEFETAPVDCE